jgi:hypothetical protein
MATYLLQCIAKLGSSVDENEGAFDSVTWLSPGISSLPDPATAPLVVQVHDTIGFAIQVKDANNNVVNNLLNWIAVSMSASTAPGNRNTRYADNESPFRIGNGQRPNTVLLATNQGGAASFQGYDATGSTTGPIVSLGTQLATVVADVPFGKSSPDRSTSQFEAVVTCSITDTKNPPQMWQFTFDPEVDTENGN